LYYEEFVQLGLGYEYPWFYVSVGGVEKGISILFLVFLWSLRQQ
jgi:hypothetical protein